ncbi:MAG: hypothetical protein IKG27_02565 [Bacilli bacterium]|nr:hypothetical protein [Bacilli bacterium]
MKKNIIIGVLIVVILILGGSLLYLNLNKDKVGCAKCTTQTKCSTNDSEQSDIEEEKTTKEEEKISSNYINAVYWNSDNSSELILFGDGKCFSLTDDSEYNSGTYIMGSGKLIVTLYVYDEKVIQTYTISSDYKTITLENGTSFEKLN